MQGIHVSWEEGMEWREGEMRGVYYPFCFGDIVPTEVNHKYTVTAKVHGPDQ